MEKVKFSEVICLSENLQQTNENLKSYRNLSDLYIVHFIHLVSENTIFYIVQVGQEKINIHISIIKLIFNS